MTTKYYLLLDEDRVVGTEENETHGAAGTRTDGKVLFPVPISVYERVKVGLMQREMFLVRAGDVELVPLESNFDKLRRMVPDAVLNAMEHELQQGVIRVQEDGVFKFPCHADIIGQLSLFSAQPGSTLQGPLYVKCFEIDTNCVTALRLSSEEISRVRDDLKLKWSSINGTYLPALKKATSAKTCEDLVDIIRTLGIEV